MADLAKVRRETLRWEIIRTLDKARPIGAPEGLVLAVMRDVFGDATELELRRELDYLEERALVKFARLPDGRWLAELTRDGVDVAEYTVDCDPGIARPAKYWAS